MKKIAFFMNNLYGGGAEKVLQTILNSFDYENYDVTLYGFSQDPLDSSIYNPAVKYKSIFADSHGIIKKIKGYIFSHFSPKFSYKCLIKDDYDILIAFTEGEVTKLVSGAPETSKKYTWVHTDLINNPWTDFLFSSTKEEAECYKKFDKIFCVSSDAERAFVEKYGISREKVFVFSNPVNTNEIIEKSKEQNNYEVSCRPLFIFMGRLEKVKGVDRLLETAKKLTEENYSFEIWVLGEGSLKEKAEKYISDNNLHSKVKLPGFCNNPYSYLNKADYLLSPSYAEAFSLVAAEAIVLGKPVFATDCAGIKDTVGDAGIISENSDEGFYLMIKKVLDNEYDTQTLKTNCRKVAENFDIDSKMKEFYKAIEE